MIGIEISKALAQAIGWKKCWTVLHQGEQKVTLCASPDGYHPEDWRIFDYRDWNVIAPIAARYNAFPINFSGVWESEVDGISYPADTPQKAIALSVIELKR